MSSQWCNVVYAGRKAKLKVGGNVFTVTVKECHFMSKLVCIEKAAPGQVLLETMSTF